MKEKIAGKGILFLITTAVTAVVGAAAVVADHIIMSNKVKKLEAQVNGANVADASEEEQTDTDKEDPESAGKKSKVVPMSNTGAGEQE